MSYYYTFKTNDSIILPNDFFKGIISNSTQIDSILKKRDDISLKDNNNLKDLKFNRIYFENKYGVQIEVLYSEDKDILGKTLVYYFKDKKPIFPLSDGKFLNIFRNTDETFTIPFKSETSNYNYIGEILIDICKKIKLDIDFEKVSEEGVSYYCYINKGIYTEKEFK